MKKKQRANFPKQGRFDVIAALSFPYVSEFQLGTCLMYYLWTFVVHDVVHEGEGMENTEEFVRGTKLSMEVFKDSEAMEVSDNPYVEVLQESQKNIPRLQKFLVQRRNTFGTEMACAVLEYSLDIDLPDIVFENATVAEMTEALCDVSMWANDLCSFNQKEQAQGDYQNFTPIFMQEYNLDLQSAIDKLAETACQRLHRHYQLKSQIHSIFQESQVSAELVRYFEGMKISSAGVTRCHYQSPSMRSVELHGS
ncbi:isoprenoid synthase domain-containing protein [Pterulicium gracile]|uniref:Terpene synthase n=1 Tax=Pterulicium gracile TaxID=1884261 RepID=A0A5C3Q0K0_9AGAR|nr:isoprenoid synthase domain-containing protein [Pterula gracilis]